ncbi:MAG: hypothetical protein AAF591_18580 [Verrucomicrobiota bacterium]
MNKERAKFLLSAYRPDHGDQDDPELQEALALAREDEELREWLEDQMNFDRGMMERVRDVSPPAGLYQDILHGVGMSLGEAEGAGVRFWDRAVVRALAAVLVIGLFVGAMLWAPWRLEDRSDVYASLNCRDCAVEVIDDLHAGVTRLDMRTAEVEEVRGFMRAAHTAGLPVGEGVDLAPVKLMGCKEIESRTGTVTIVCFRREGKLYHLATFEIRDGHGPEIPGADAPEMTHHGELLAAMWREGGVGRVLFTTQGEASEEDVERMVAELTV